MNSSRRLLKLLNPFSPCPNFYISQPYYFFNTLNSLVCPGGSRLFCRADTADGDVVVDAVTNSVRGVAENDDNADTDERSGDVDTDAADDVLIFDGLS